MSFIHLLLIIPNTEQSFITKQEAYFAQIYSKGHIHARALSPFAFDNIFSSFFFKLKFDSNHQQDFFFPSLFIPFFFLSFKEDLKNGSMVNMTAVNRSFPLLKSDMEKHNKKEKGNRV